MSANDSVDIVAFLLARIGDDEMIALAAMPGPWYSWIEGRDGKGGDDFLYSYPADSDQVDVYLRFDEAPREMRHATQDHMARWSAARVLVECEAKRALINYVQGVEYQIDGEWGIHGDYRDADGKAIYFGPNLMEGLRLMARVWSDHPLFDPAWAA